MSNEKIIWTPLPGSQTLAMSCPAHIIVYHGSRGPGKTDSQLMRFRKLVGQGYGRHWRGVIFDREYKNLDDLVSKSQRWFPEFYDGCRFINSKSDYKWVWKTGEELLFRTVKKDQDYWGFHGQEFPFIGWNELTKYPNDNLFEMMMSCNRSSFRPEDYPFYINGDLLNKKGIINYVTKDHKHSIEKFLPDIPLEVFATCNPHGCVPFGEVLTTSRGWVDIKDINIGEMVVSVDSNGIAKNSVVTNVIKKQWSGEMIKRDGRGMYMEFTDDHRLPHLSENKTTFTLKEFKNLPGHCSIKRCADGWKGTDLYSFKVPQVKTRVRKLNQPIEVSINDYAEFMGWFLSEGFTLNRDKMVGISQTKPDNRVLIADLLTRMGFNFKSTFQNFTFYCPDWFAYLEQFGKCRDKFIPSRLKQANTEVLQILLDSLMKGDGSNGVYYSLSKQLADDVAEIGIKLGYRVYISTRKNGRGDLTSKRGIKDEVCYQVNLSKGSAIGLRTGNLIYDVPGINSTKDSNIERTNFSGIVYCLTVPETETFFIRQNGCVWLSGNSGHNWVKKRFISASKMGQLKKNIINVYNPKTQQREDVVKTQVHIFGSYRENKYLSPEYVATLESIDEPNKRRAWLMGDWDVVAGGMFDDLWDSRTNIVEPFSIPETWRIDRSFDWGSSKPFSVGWWAESDGCDIKLTDGTIRHTIRGDLFRINEWYGCTTKPNEGLRMLGSEVSKGIIERELSMGIYKRVHPGPADNSIYDVENGNSIASSMANPVKINGNKYPGVMWIRSDKSSGSRKAGWEKMRLYMKQSKPATIIDSVTKEKSYIPREYPGLFIFNNCKNFIDLVPILPRDEIDPDDVDTDAEDHIGDEARYKLLSIGIGAKGGKTKGVQ